MGKATQTIRGKRAVGRRRAARLGGAARGRPRDQGAGPAPSRRATSSSSKRRSQRAGGHVHWARDAAEANAIVARIVAAHGAGEVVKIKSLTTDEIGLNEALAAAGIEAIETDLAELIIQLAGERSSHILVPGDPQEPLRDPRPVPRDSSGARADLTDEPKALAAAARAHLRKQFLRTPVAVSGANFAVAETGTVCIVESEGNGRMCLTLPDVLISVMGLEKVIPTWQDFEVFLQLLPRSSTGERMNPYTSFWTGVTPGDGPRGVPPRPARQRPHQGARRPGRPPGAELHPLQRLPEHLPGLRAHRRPCLQSVYPGPIGAILTPQLAGVENAAGSLPYASSLCGACYEVCPVKINIPEVLVHLRHETVARSARAHGARERVSAEHVAMRAMARVFANRRLYEAAQRAGRLTQWPLVRGGTIRRLPGPLSGWTSARDLPALPEQSFRDWWRERS